MQTLIDNVQLESQKSYGIWEGSNKLNKNRKERGKIGRTNVAENSFWGKGSKTIFWGKGGVKPYFEG